jgi:hypothetical protein
LGIAAAAAMHGAAYVDYCRAMAEAEERDPRRTLLRHLDAESGPLSLWEFLQREAASGRPWLGGVWRGGAAWATWGIDAALMAVAAAAVFAWITRQDDNRVPVGLTPYPTDESGRGG